MVDVLDGEQEYYINDGYADKKKNMEVTVDTTFELASTTKAFTALGILLLEQEGRLDRNDSVCKYLPWFVPTYDGKAADITVEHLLCHTSGIPAWTIANIPIGTGSDHGWLEKTIRNIQAVELDHLPGTVHTYATINYDVLALIMEEVAGITYEEYIEQNVLEPLGMSDSYFRVDNSKTNQSAQGYRYTFMNAMKYDAPTFYGNTAAGYLISTAEDLMIWMKVQMGIFEMDRTEAIEKIESAIIESHSYPIEEEQHYFAGWNLYDTYFCHSGNNPNFSAQVIIDCMDKKAVFALANICGSAATNTADGVYRMIHGEKVKIGFWMDGNSLVDLLGFLFCLVELYVGFLLFEKRNQKRKYACVKAVVSLLFAVTITVSPYLLHYNYKTLFVWCSPCMLLAVAGSVICLGGYFAGYMYQRIKRCGR